VDWNVPDPDKEYGTAGKLVDPGLEFAGHESELANVGKLKIPAFGDGGSTGPPPKTKSWKTKKTLDLDPKAKK